MKKFAVIFDMDGVLILSNPYHKIAWKEFFKRHKFDLKEEELKQNVYGKINPEIIKHYFPDITNEEVKKFSEEKEEIYREIIDKNFSYPNGMYRFLDIIKDKKVRTAIATSAPPKNVEFVSKKLNLRKYFSTILDDSHVTRGKPDPEIYLKTAETIGFSPKNCIVIEDSISGIKSGLDAGMKVIALTTTHTKEELGMANLVVSDFSELNFEILEKLMKQTS